jgi:hypothetical protein
VIASLAVPPVIGGRGGGRGVGDGQDRPAGAEREVHGADAGVGDARGAVPAFAMPNPASVWP